MWVNSRCSEKNCDKHSKNKRYKNNITSCLQWTPVLIYKLFLEGFTWIYFIWDNICSNEFTIIFYKRIFVLLQTTIRIIVVLLINSQVSHRLKRTKALLFFSTTKIQTYSSISLYSNYYYSYKNYFMKLLYLPHFSSGTN